MPTRSSKLKQHQHFQLLGHILLQHAVRHTRSAGGTCHTYVADWNKKSPTALHNEKTLVDTKPSLSSAPFPPHTLAAQLKATADWHSLTALCPYATAEDLDGGRFYTAPAKLRGRGAIVGEKRDSAGCCSLTENKASALQRLNTAEKQAHSLAAAEALELKRALIRSERMQESLRAQPRFAQVDSIAIPSDTAVSSPLKLLWYVTQEKEGDKNADEREDKIVALEDPSVDFDGTTQQQEQQQDVPSLHEQQSIAASILFFNTTRNPNQHSSQFAPEDSESTSTEGGSPQHSAMRKTGVNAMYASTRVKRLPTLHIGFDFESCEVTSSPGTPTFGTRPPTSFVRVVQMRATDSIVGTRKSYNILRRCKVRDSGVSEILAEDPILADVNLAFLRACEQARRVAGGFNLFLIVSRDIESEEESAPMTSGAWGQFDSVRESGSEDLGEWVLYEEMDDLNGQMNAVSVERLLITSSLIVTMMVHGGMAAP
ncbi:hypothetical protein SVAN01_07021 [Stagonosporopsis vannaccii]|nr:hypothetical protein SVAN01_07021 [Stagonosporopsis vannaccii]